MNYYKGNFYQDYENELNLRRGWLVGPFMNEKNNDKRGTDKVAIKFWKFNANEATGHKKKYQRFATEVTFILKGRIRAQIDDQSIELVKGDYVVIPPNTISNLAIKALEYTEGLTIKAPGFFPQDDTVKLEQ